jgi:hypothetical protein
VKEMMREAMTEHFTESGDGAQVWEAPYTTVCKHWKSIHFGFRLSQIETMTARIPD